MLVLVQDLPRDKADPVLNVAILCLIVLPTRYRSRRLASISNPWARCFSMSSSTQLHVAPFNCLIFMPQAKW